MNHSWIVCYFHLDECVEAIPKSWYLPKKSQALYPPEDLYSKSQILDAIKHNEPAKSSWQSYDVTFLVGDYDSFKIASSKANKARSSDKLTSQSEGEKGRGKRQKRKRHLSSSSSISAGQLSSDGENEDRPKFPTPPAKQKSFSRKKVLGSFDQADSCKARQECASQEYSMNLQPKIITVNPSNESNTPKTNPSSAFPIPSEAFQRQVMRSLNLINSKLTQLGETADDIVRSINNQRERGNSDTDAVDFSGIMSLFPLRNNEDVKHLENTIEENRLEDGLAKELSRVGGDDPRKITKRIMYRIMTNGVGQLYSFEGAKGKNVFKSLKLFSVVIKAVRLNARTSSATDDEIIQPIKLWLAQAKNRLKNKRVSEVNHEEPEPQ